VNLEHPDQLAELVAQVTTRRNEAVTDAEPYDMVAALPPGRDPIPYTTVGATWWLVELPGGFGLRRPAAQRDPRWPHPNATTGTPASRDARGLTRRREGGLHQSAHLAPESALTDRPDLAGR
jgi:hypothetical protein